MQIPHLKEQELADRWGCSVKTIRRRLWGNQRVGQAAPFIR